MYDSDKQITFCKENCVEGESEMKIRCRCWYWTAVLSRIPLDLVSIALLITLCVKTNTNFYGESVLKPIFMYALGSLICFLVWCLFGIYQIFLHLRPGLIFCATAFEFAAFVFIIRAYAFTSTSYADEIKEFAFANWRLDLQLIRFQSNHGCDGILAANDTCEICCDEDYDSVINNVLGNFNIYCVCITVFMAISLFFATIPECVTQIICE